MQSHQLNLLYMTPTLGDWSLSYYYFPRLRDSENILWSFIYLCVSACGSIVAETVNVKLNLTGSIKSAGFSYWNIPSSHFKNVVSAIEVNCHNLIIQQRTLNSVMTREELRSGSFATVVISNLHNKSAERSFAVPITNLHELV